MSEDLKAMFATALSKGSTPVVLETSVEAFAAMENSAVIARVRVPFASPKPMYRQEGWGQTRQHVHCVATHMDYNTTLFKSTVRDELGNLVKGTGIEVCGFDCEVDAQGHPIKKSIPNPAKEVSKEAKKDDSIPETIEVLSLIDHDEDGNALEPKTLMVWRPMWGTDRSKLQHSRLRDADQLVMVPNIGVPRKSTTVSEGGELNAEEARRQYDSVDFTLVPGIEKMLKNPLINAQDGSPLKEFISHIGVASNAPSRKAEGTQGYKPAVANQQVVAAVPKDPFAGAPESNG